MDVFVFFAAHSKGVCVWTGTQLFALHNDTMKFDAANDIQEMSGMYCVHGC